MTMILSKTFLPLLLSLSSLTPSHQAFLLPDQHYHRQHAALYASVKSKSASGSRPSSTTSKNSNKKKTSNKNKSSSSSSSNSICAKGRSPGPGRSLSEDELNDHVSARYITGPGGPLDKRVRTRGVFYDTAMTGSNDEDVEDDDESSYSIMNPQQQQYLKELNNRPALCLNADYMPLSYLPLSLWTWQDAVKAIFSGKVSVVDVYPDITVRAANIEVPLPSVIALTDYVAHKNNRPAFTRRNVFLRDEYKCQYCSGRFHTADLSLDHVVPRCQGGILSWENAVTSCLKCNGKKGSIPLTELKSIGMKLLQEPKVPTQMELMAKAARMVPKRVHPTWKPYLGIHERPSSSYASSGDEQFIDDRYFEEEI